MHAEFLPLPAYDTPPQSTGDVALASSEQNVGFSCNARTISDDWMEPLESKAVRSKLGFFSDRKRYI